MDDSTGYFCCKQEIGNKNYMVLTKFKNKFLAYAFIQKRKLYVYKKLQLNIMRTSEVDGSMALKY